MKTTLITASFNQFAIRGRYYEGLCLLEKSVNSSPEISKLDLFEISNKRGYFQIMIGKLKHARKQLFTNPENEISPTSYCENIVYRALWYFYSGKIEDACSTLSESYIYAKSENLPILQIAHIVYLYGDFNRAMHESELALKRYSEAINLLSDFPPLNWLHLLCILRSIEVDNVNVYNPSTLKNELNKLMIPIQANDWLLHQQILHTVFAQFYLNITEIVNANDHLEAAIKTQKISGYYWIQEKLRNIKEEILEGR